MDGEHCHIDHQGGAGVAAGHTHDDTGERAYLDQIRRSVLQLVAAFSRYNPTSRFTLDIRIVERKDSVQKIA